MHNRYREKIIVIAGAFLLIILFALSERYFLRLDITDRKLFTLTRVSRTLYKEIPQPIIINYYVSKNSERFLPSISDVKDMLNEFKVSSHGKIQLIISHPEKKADRDRLETMGIVPIKIKMVKNNEKSTLEVYSGIKIQFLNRSKIIPAIFTADNLEYQIVSSIRELIQNRRRVVGILIGDNTRKMNTDYTLLRDNLSNDFDLKVFTADSNEITAINVLVVIGNVNLSPINIEKIDQFIERGGNVLFAVDGVHIDLEKNLKARSLKGNILLEYLQKKYGVLVKSGLVLDPFSKEFRIPKDIYGSVAWQTIGAYPEWVHIQKSSVSPDSPVTAHFAGLDLLWTSPLVLTGAARKASEILLKSSTLAWEMDSHYKTSPYTAGSYGPGKGSVHHQFDLAVSLSYGKSRLIVVGDSDFLSNLIQYSDSYYNLAFVHNCVDWLSQNEDFMSIRTRHERDPFLDTYGKKEKAAVYFVSKIINLFIIPFLILVAGFIQYIRETRKR